MEKVQARWHFAIPIYDVVLDGFKTYQSELRAYFLSLAAKGDKGLTRSNLGGWHSDDQLHLSENSEVRWLMQNIMRISTACIRDFEKKPDQPAEPLMTNAWVNVNQAQDWNVPHTHIPSDWSGVAYIDVGDSASEIGEATKAGDIMFFNPLPMGQAQKRPATVNYTPQVGQLILFPSYLMHMVAPHQSSDPRISVAFNIQLPQQLMPKQL
ncbi:TIGR02466 family protein [Agaribacterium sp. ZY112]|uniref:TIGR02466 family protein n=1 Tax=Agaribacterium sp. ZY112 TaxID=3233574 RepID=UPI003523BBCB